MHLRSVVVVVLGLAQLSCAHGDGTSSVRAAIQEAIEAGNQTGKGQWRAIERAHVANLSVEQYEFGPWRRLILGVDGDRSAFAFALEFQVADPSEVATLKKAIENALRTRDFNAAFESGASVQMERTESGVRVIAVAPPAALSWAIAYFAPLFEPLNLPSSKHSQSVEQDSLSDDLPELTPVSGSTAAEAQKFSMTAVAVAGQFDRGTLLRELAELPSFPPSAPEAPSPSRKPVSSDSGPSVLWSLDLGEAHHWPQAEILMEALALRSQPSIDDAHSPKNRSPAIATEISVRRHGGHTRLDVRDTLKDVRSATVAAAARTAEMRTLVTAPEGAALWQRAGVRYADRLLRALDVPSSSAALLGALQSIGIGPSALFTHYRDLRNRQLLVPQELRQAITQTPAAVRVEKPSEGSR